MTSPASVLAGGTCLRDFLVDGQTAADTKDEAARREVAGQQKNGGVRDKKRLCTVHGTRLLFIQCHLSLEGPKIDRLAVGRLDSGSMSGTCLHESESSLWPAVLTANEPLINTRCGSDWRDDQLDPLLAACYRNVMRN